MSARERRGADPLSAGAAVATQWAAMRIVTQLERTLTASDPVHALRELRVLRAELDALEVDRVRAALESGAQLRGRRPRSRHHPPGRAPPLPASDGGPPRLVATQEALALLQRARHEAARLGSATVEPEHVALALVAHPPAAWRHAARRARPGLFDALARVGPRSGSTNSCAPPPRTRVRARCRSATSTAWRSSRVERVVLHPEPFERISRAAGAAVSAPKPPFSTVTDDDDRPLGVVGRRRRTRPRRVVARSAVPVLPYTRSPHRPALKTSADVPPAPGGAPQAFEDGGAVARVEARLAARMGGVVDRDLVVRPRPPCRGAGARSCRRWRAPRRRRRPGSAWPAGRPGRRRG